MASFSSYDDVIPVFFHVDSFENELLLDSNEATICGNDPRGV